MSRGCKASFQNTSVRKHGAYQGAAEGIASPSLLPPQFCAPSLVRPNTATLATAILGNQTGSGARLKHWHVVSHPCYLVIGLLPPQAALTQAMPGQTAGATCKKDFSQ